MDDSHPVGERNIRLVIEFEGTAFSGWQRQRGYRTVQDAVEDAVAVVTGRRSSVLASGRTDAGVHAEGLVAGFRTACLLPVQRLVAALNANLPDDVAVVSAEEVPFSFHATRDARGKLYRYRIATRPVRPVLDRRRAWWVRAPLDVERMRQAAAHLVGTHDFNSFRAEGSVEKNTVRTVDAIDFQARDGEIVISFRGKGFLYMMLRIIVGTLVRVGMGRLEPSAIPDILAARHRGAAGPTAPPHGLTLVEVYY